LQHTPSTQKLLAHSRASAHEPPATFFATHAPDEHQASEAQSASTAHAVLHAIASQA
jgi:hypothetical protein